MLKDYLVDLHIHIGAGRNGQAVKITASRKLNFENILKESLYNKGLNMVGIIDCASPVVISDMEKLLASGEMIELDDGGTKYGDLVIIPGSEVESREKNGGQAHYLAYFPYLKNIKDYSEVMSQYISNINLSSQSTGLTGKEILQIVEFHGGVLIPAHVFTPYKSFYGRSFKSYKEVFSDEEWDRIPAIELGLSADTHLADFMEELEDKTFISNSDAHSLIKIAREYNMIRMKSLSFREFIYALKRKKGRKVVKNFGLDPRLGKYHRSYCPECEKNFPQKFPVLKCPECGKQDIVIGVKDRILEISNNRGSISPSCRGDYMYQIPLSNIPGIGKKTYQNLLEEFGTEMNVLHQTKADDLLKIVDKNIRDRIIKARSGNIEIRDGGGGHYGKVMG
ncbi:MAG: endonuclease Q family protein [Halanaerobiales bacterium]